VTEVILTSASTLAKESTSAIHMDWYRDHGFARRWLPTPVDPHCAPALKLTQLPRTISVLTSTVDAGAK
jgi:hypothetical protein